MKHYDVVTEIKIERPFRWYNVDQGYYLEDWQRLYPHVTKIDVTYNHRATHTVATAYNDGGKMLWSTYCN